MPRILILAGEASGDMHGASLAESLRKLDPNIELAGLGGPRMEEAGVRLLSGIDKLDIIGVPTVPELLRAYAVFRKLSQYIRETAFDAVVLIDNPGLNLRLARVAKQSGHRVVYYIAPQVWAWNEGRSKKLRKYVDRLLVILPFEKDYFGKARIDCRFVGHPIMDELPETPDVPALRAEFGLDPQASVVALLPGSRKSEIQRLLPAMLAAVRQLHDEAGRQGRILQFVLAHAPAIPDAMIASFISSAGVELKVIRGRAFDAIAVCDAAMVASGTATLQTALVGRPLTIVYRISALSYQIYKRLIRVPWIGLANLVAGRQIAQELIQDDVTAERLAAETMKLLNAANAELARETAAELRSKFGPPGASDRAAAEIIALMASSAGT